jgi:hypothetical protein
LVACPTCVGDSAARENTRESRRSQNEQLAVQHLERSRRWSSSRGRGSGQPKVGKVQLKVKGKSVGGTASSETLPSYGIVYMVPMFAGSELRPSDINGACAFVELNAGVVAGAAGYAMLFGMSPAWFAAALIGGATAGGHFWHQALQTATGVLLFAGANVGPQFGYGGMAFGGYLREDPF